MCHKLTKRSLNSRRVPAQIFSINLIFLLYGHRTRVSVSSIPFNYLAYSSTFATNSTFQKELDANEKKRKEKYDEQEVRLRRVHRINRTYCKGRVHVSSMMRPYVAGAFYSHAKQRGQATVLQSDGGFVFVVGRWTSMNN